MSTVSKVALTGITGRLGSRIARNVLAQSPTAIIHALARTPSKVDPAFTSHPRVRVFQGDATDAGANRALVRGTDVAVAAFLTADNEVMYEGQRAMIDACDAEGVPRFVASDWSFDYTPLALGDMPPKDPMIRVKRYLEGEKRGKVAGVHVLNGGFVDLMSGMMAGGDGVALLGGGDAKLDFTSYEAAAQFTAALALDASATGVFRIREHHVSLKELVAAIADVSGKPVPTKPGPSLEQIKGMIAEKRASLKPGEQIGWDFLPVMYLYYMHVHPLGPDSALDNGRYPGVVQFRPLKEVLAESMAE